MLGRGINKSSSLLHMNFPFLLWGFVVLSQDVFGGRTCVSVQRCTTESCSLSEPGDVRAVLSQENVHPDCVHYRENEWHGSQVVSFQFVKWKGSPVLTSLSMVLKAWLGIGYKCRWVTAQQWNAFNAYFYPKWPLSDRLSVELSWFWVAEDVIWLDHQWLCKWNMKQIV